MNRNAFYRMGAARSPRVACHQTSARVVGYRGFDGLEWPQRERLAVELVGGLAPLDAYEDVRRYLRMLDGAAECDMVMLNAVDSDSFTQTIPPLWKPIGWDLGYYESETSHFSALLSEILFGELERMRDLAKTLNACSLFSTREQAAEAASIHAELAASGADVETVGTMAPVHISARDSG